MAIAFMKHDAHPGAEVFKFREERNLGVFICKRVAEGATILHVSHEADGDWQFLCGGQHEDDGEDGALVVCLEGVVVRDPSLNELAEMCRGSYADRAAQGESWLVTDEQEEFIRHHVKETGWAVQLVENDDADEGLPEFAYTIGLYQNYQQPEIIVFGVELATMHEILNVCGEKVQAGETLALGSPVAEVLKGYEVRFRAVRARTSYDEHLGYAIWFYDGREFPVVQLLWPDKAGRFPDDPASTAEFRKFQPLLP
jgi:hypothetical protein